MKFFKTTFMEKFHLKIDFYLNIISSKSSNSNSYIASLKSTALDTLLY